VNAPTIRAVLAAVALAFCSFASWSQDGPTRVDGRITEAGKSLVGVQVVLSHEDTFQVFRATTDKYGTFSISDVPRGTYVVSILKATGDKLYRQTLKLTSAPDAPVRLDIDISGTPASPPSSSTPAPVTGPAPASQYKGNPELDSLIRRYENAVRAGDHQAEISLLKAIVAADPTRWDYFEALGDAQANAGDYESAALSYEKGIQAAQQIMATPTSKDSMVLQSDRDRAKAGMANMLIGQGNAFLRLKKNDEAIAAYTKAAELSPDPATAYFNLCVAHYTTKKTEGALEACDKAIAADPSKADAYLIKGSLLIARSTTDKTGKVQAPPGTAEALKKYLELAPNGPHANDVKQMLEYIGVKVDAPGRSGTQP